MSLPSVDVVVPVHGGWAHVKRCLAALEAQSHPCRVIVVDDKSPDDTAMRVASEFPEFELIENDLNRGFAATCNVGINHGDADIVVLINSDVTLESDFILRLRNAMSEDVDRGSRIGSAFAMLLTPDGLVDSFGITADKTVAGFVRYHRADECRASKETPPVLGPYGAVAAYRRRALEDVGMLDEGIFMYGEELDLGLRLRAANWKTIPITGVAGQHIGGASAGRGSARQRFLAGFGRGYLLRAWKVLRGRQALRALLVEFLVCAHRLILHRDLSSTRGRLAGWKAARGVVRPRIPVDGVDGSISMMQSIKMRSDSYWTN